MDDTTRKTARILIVDDEPTITELISYVLAREGYAPETTASAEEALVLAKSNHYDLFILDVVLPGVDGYTLCRSIRTFSPAPVLFLSARDTELDKVVGFEMGADDYQVKPFGIRELIARVRALLRRSEGMISDGRGSGKSIAIAGGITLNEDAHTAEGPNGPIDLTPREFELLAYLMKAEGRVVSREDLLRDAWGWEYLVESKTVDAHINRLRNKLKVSGHDPKLITTVRGFGYKFGAAK